jgi:hypothetical protein
MVAPQIKNFPNRFRHLPSRLGLSRLDDNNPFASKQQEHVTGLPRISLEKFPYH